MGDKIDNVFGRPLEGVCPDVRRRQHMYRTFLYRKVFKSGTSFSIFYLEIFQYGFIMVLCRQACIGQVSECIRPFTQSAIIEHFKFVGYYERYNFMIEALLEHYQPFDTAVAVLKRVYKLKSLVKVKDFLQVNCFFAIYSFSNARMAAATFRGSTVSKPPTSLGKRLYSPTANHDFNASDVPDLSNLCICFIMLSDSGSQAWSIM